MGKHRELIAGGAELEEGTKEVMSDLRPEGEMGKVNQSVALLGN